MDYFMGIDEGGYDGRTFAMVTISSDKTIVAHYFGRDKQEFDKQVEEAAAQYNIPSEKIMWETK